MGQNTRTRDYYNKCLISRWINSLWRNGNIKIVNGEIFELGKKCKSFHIIEITEMKR